LKENLSMKKTRLWAALLASTSLISAPLTPVYAAGSDSTLPVVGGNSFCASTVTGTGALGGITGTGQGTTGSICGQTVPAGPPGLTGTEILQGDVTGNAATGASPQTVVIPVGILGGTERNRLIGGDFATNLWQRGTTFTAITPTAAEMTADRIWAYSASNTMTVTKQTPANTAADYLGSIGLDSWMRVARPSGTPSGASCVGETLDANAAAPLIGNNAVFSFYGYAPTTFSAAGYDVVVTIAWFTAADAAGTQATIGYAGGNSSTFALGTTTGYTAAAPVLGPGTPGSVTTTAATIPLSVTPTRYVVAAPVPVANASGTAVTALGVQICATPTFTTTVSTDYFEVTGLQLEAKPSTVTPQFPNGVISASGFERRLPQLEASYELAYSYVISESATVVNYRGVCVDSSTSLANCNIQFPVPMRITPAMKYTAGFESSTTGAATAASACTALTTSATLTGSAATKSNVLVDCASSAAFGAVGVGGFLWDSGSAANGVISASAEP
jgi:hypothetical protein